MTIKIKKITAIVLMLALLLSLGACKNENASENVSGETPQHEMATATPSKTASPTPLQSEIPLSTVVPSSGENVEVKEAVSDAFGVNLYAYDTQYSSENQNYVVIRMNGEDLLSKDLYITDIDVSYDGDGEFEDEEIIPNLEDGILINKTTMEKFWGTYEYNDYQVEYLQALARDENGEYFKVEYNNANKYWQDCESKMQLGENEEIYIGLPLKDSGTYETNITFEIKDSEEAYDFGYFEKEIADGEEFTLTANSKIKKAKAEVFVLPQVTKYDTSQDKDKTAVDSQYIELSFETQADNNISNYIMVKTNGVEDANALSELVKIIDYDEVFPYIYISESLANTPNKNAEINLAFMEESGNNSSVKEDNHIEENDLLWVNYEFSISSGKWYVFDDSTFGEDNSSVGTAIDYIFSITYENVSSSDVKYDFTASTQAVELANSTYEKLSDAEKAYMLSLDRSEIHSLAFYQKSIGTPEQSFGYWLKEKSLSSSDNYDGYDIIAYLDSAKEYLNELEIVSSFKEYLEKNDLWNSETSSMVSFNKDSTTMVTNLNTVLRYLNEMIKEDIAVIKNRSEEEYQTLLLWEEQIVTQDVEYVMSQITALSASYLVSDLTNLLLYVDLDSSNQSVNGLLATHMIYSPSLFEEIKRTSEAFESLSPEKQDLLSVWKLNIINGEESISNYKNQYYYNPSLISSEDFFVTFNITYADVISALVQMAEVAENLNEIFSYVDYSSYFETDIAKTRFIDLLFGDVDNGYNDCYFGNGNGLFVDVTADIEDQNNNFAMADIAKAYGKSVEVQNAIKSEYKNFIELLIYIEEYKLQIAGEYENIMLEEITQNNDYSIQTVVTMQARIEDYIQGILEEDKILINDEDCLVNVFEYLMNEGFENIDEAKELVEDCFDSGEIAEYMIDKEGYEQE